jgi:electron transport complex protein RnfC
MILFSVTDSSPAAPPAHPREAPEFSILQCAGTLKIPLTFHRTHAQPPIEVPAVHLDRAQAMPVVAGDTVHRALAPTAGTLRSACEVTLFAGYSVPAVEFVCDVSSSSGDETIAKPARNDERFATLQSIRKEELGAWIERLKEAGIWADRRASPDLLGQLFQAIKRPVDTVLCNMLDSDPSACLNAAIASQFPQEVVAGTLLLARLVEAPQVALCGDQRLPSNWWNGIRQLVRKTSTRLLPMANDYPQADPTLLLYTLLSRRLRPARLPVEQGVIVLDAAAAFAIGRLFLADEPMLQVPVVIRHHARKLSHFVMAPIGMPLCDLLSLLGEPQPNLLIRGGDLLRDIRLTRDAVVGGSELVLHTSNQEPDINPDACIRCSWCAEACPTRVHPAVVLESSQRDDIELAENAGIDACIDCGICSYVCPSKLPLLEGIRVMKKRHEV